MAVNVTKLQALIGADDRELDRVLAGVDKKLERAGRRAESIGRSLTIGITTPIAAAAGLGVKQLVAFDEQMRNVNSIAGESEQQFEATSRAVLGLSTDFGKGATDLAKGLYDINSSGFQGAEGLTVLTAATKAARAGVADVGQSAAGLTAVLNAYGLQANEAARISDIMFQTVKDGVITFPELANQIGDVISTASAVGVRFEEIGGAISTMTVKGVNASETMTALNQVIVQLISPSQQAMKVAKGLGLNWLAAGKGAQHLQDVGLQKTMAEIAEATGGSADQMAALFPEVRSLKGAFILAADGAQTFEKFVRNATESAGAAEHALEEQQKSFAYQFQQTWAKINGALIETTNLFGPEMKSIADSIDGAIDAFRDLPDPVQKGAASLILLAAGAGPALVVLGKLPAAIGAVRAGLVLLASSSETVALRALYAWDTINLLSTGMRTGGVAGARALIAANGGLATSLGGSTAAASGLSRVLSLLTNPITLVVGALGGLTYALWKSHEGWKANIQSASQARAAIASARAELAGMSRDELAAERKKNLAALAGIDAKKRKVMEIVEAEEQAAQFPLNESAGLYSIGAGLEMGKLNKQATDLQNKLKAVNQELAGLDKQDAERKRAAEQLRKDLQAQSGALNSVLDRGSSGGSGASKVAREMTEAERATESLNAQIRDLNRQLALGSDTSQAAAMRYDVLAGAYAEADRNTQQWALHQAMAVDAQAEAQKRTAEQKELLQSASGAMEQWNRDLALGGNASEVAALKYELFAGSMAGLPPLIKTAILSLAAERAEMQATAEQAESLAGILRNARIDSLRSMADLSGGEDLRVFLDQFSNLIPKDASLGSLEELRQLIDRLPDETRASFDEVVRIINETGDRTATKELQDKIRDVVGSARAEYSKLLAEQSGDGALKAYIEHFATITDLEAVQAIDDLRRAFEAESPAIRDASRETGEWEQKTAAAAESARRTQSAMESLDKLLSDQGVELARLTGQWTTADDILRSLNITASDLSEEGLAKLNQAVANAANIEAAAGIRAFVDDMRGMFTDAFESIFTDGFGRFFDNVLGGLDRLLQQMAAKILAAEVMNLLIGATGGSGGWLGQVAGAAFGGGKASGGPVRSGTPYLVGERGPELFVPRGGGSIVPNNRLAVAGNSGAVIHYSPTYTITTPNPEAFRRSQRQILDDAGRQMNEIMRRNG